LVRLELTGIQIKIIWRLSRRSKYGGSHTAMENALKGFPSHLGRDVREAFYGLVKLGLVVLRPTGYGMQVSLNKELIPTIRAICLWYADRIPHVEDSQTYGIEMV